MAQPYPDGTLIGIIIMAILILAFLWRDKISSGGGGGTGGTGGGTADIGPNIHGHHRGDNEVGGSYRVEGSYSTGSADNFDIEANLNGSRVNVEAANGEFRTQEVNVGEQNEYRVEITTNIGSDYDEGSFPGREGSPTSEESPKVSVTRERVDDEQGAFDLVAEAEPGSAEIEATGFVKMLHVESGRGFDYEQNPAQSQYIATGRSFEYSDSGKPPGTYHYTAWTIDAEGRNDTYTDSFTIESPSERRGGGFAGGGGGQPLIIYNPQILEERAGELPPEFLQAIESLAESIREDGDDEVVVELGQELESLVAAVESLEEELSGQDFEKLVEEIRKLRQEVESGSVNVSSLEVQITEIIALIRSEGEVGSDGFDPRNRWQLVSYLIERDGRLSDSLKDDLFDLFMVHRGSGYGMDDFSMQKVYGIRKALSIPEKKELENIISDLLDFMVESGMRSIGEEEVNEIYRFLKERIDTLSGDFKSDIKAKTSSSNMPSTAKDVKATVQDFKNVSEIEVDLEDRLEDFRYHLKEFEKIFEQNEEVFEAIDQIQFTNYSKKASPQEMYSTIKKLDQEVTLDLADEQAAMNLQNAVEAMIEHLKACFNDLEQMEVDIKKELGEMTNAEEPLNDLETHVEDLEVLVEMLKVYNSDQ